MTAAGLFFFGCALLLSACASLSGPDLPVAPPGGAARVIVRGGPFYPQEKYQCGPASLAMLLTWSGAATTPEALVPEIYTPARRGGLQSALIAGARRHGRIAYPIAGLEMLFAEIEAGRPVLVLQNLAFSWYPKWHYAVVVGYDRHERVVFLHTGTRENEKISLRLFNNTWARGGFWGLLVLEPSLLPVKVDAAAWLDAAVGLELAEQWPAAAVAFGKASERWPQNHAAWIGLGNSRFSLHDSEGAALAFERATRLQPESGVAHNNLAQALAAMGRYDEALTAARRAVTLGGPFLEQFRATLAKIETAAPGL